MNTKHLFAALAAVSVMAHAADTPGSNPSLPAAPSVKERLATARKAIDAKDWSSAMSDWTRGTRARTSTSVRPT